VQDAYKKEKHYFVAISYQWRRELEALFDGSLDEVEGENLK